MNKFRPELTFVIDENQIQRLVDKDLIQTFQHRKNFSVLEDEMPSKSFLNLENAKRGYNEVKMIKKENPN